MRLCILIHGVFTCPTIVCLIQFGNSLVLLLLLILTICVPLRSFFAILANLLGTILVLGNVVVVGVVKLIDLDRLHIVREVGVKHLRAIRVNRHFAQLKIVIKLLIGPRRQHRVVLLVEVPRLLCWRWQNILLLRRLG